MPSSSDQTHETETVHTLLERLSIEGIDAYNTRDWDRVRSQYESVPSYGIAVGSLTGSRPVSREKYIEVYQEMVRQSPEHHMAVTKAKAEVNAGEDLATVYMDIILTGHPPGVRQPVMVIVEWKKVDHKWLLVKSVSMRGTPGTTIPGAV